MQKLVLGQKVKMKLSQPSIMCSGRKSVECYYRGKVTGINPTHARILFKRYGAEDEYFYNLETQEFEDEDLKDIVIL